ncbi:hypothetical protein K474DRAFT_1078125 [Panus rudis PR-1116 ss-1]|nr:hypothetical protein K474DRAFT_1078125 [Panus rudis PR-1116 ss-1]
MEPGAGSKFQGCPIIARMSFPYLVHEGQKLCQSDILRRSSIWGDLTVHSTVVPAPYTYRFPCSLTQERPSPAVTSHIPKASTMELSGVNRTTISLALASRHDQRLFLLPVEKGYILANGTLMPRYSRHIVPSPFSIPAMFAQVTASGIRVMHPCPLLGPAKPPRFDASHPFSEPCNTHCMPHSQSWGDLYSKTLGGSMQGRK